jgi:hypothetical protein
LLGGRLAGGFFSAGAATGGSAFFDSFSSSFKGAEDTYDLGFLLALAGADLGFPSKLSGISQGLDALEELRLCTFSSSWVS